MRTEYKFIVDHNVGKLAKWLRMMGYDTLFFTGDDDWQMVITALNEDRVILTRDSHIMNRGVITRGRLKALLIQSENPDEQKRQVIETFNLDTRARLFTLCLECNQPLGKRTKEQVKDRVPPYVFQTQDQFVECPSCNRIYWKGTHWQEMTRRLEKLATESAGK
ncbi:MAG: Mut7-C RNAse domain-containing protein [Dehalococcoidales bacterium]|nr:Mut7-C RNAse domain-containing protein [Dehalococcoidales bacterium]